MADPFYVARAEVHKIAGVHRQARLETGTVVEFGVHGPIRIHYRLEGAEELPLPVDYLVAAVGG